MGIEGEEPGKGTVVSERYMAYVGFIKGACKAEQRVHLK